MNKTFRCEHCGRILKLNHRLKGNQQYCSEKACQKARVCDWKRRRYSGHQDYRDRCKEWSADWRKKVGADKYQRKYREKHPAYVERNRVLQKQGNRKDVHKPTPIVVKELSIILEPWDGGSYAPLLVINPKLVDWNRLKAQSIAV